MSMVNGERRDGQKKNQYTPTKKKKKKSMLYDEQEESKQEIGYPNFKVFIKY